MKCFWFYINFDGLVAWKKPLFLEQGTVPPMRKLVHNHVPQKHGYKMNKSAKIIQVCKIKNKFEIINIQVCKRNKSANKNQGEFQISDQIQSKWPKSFLQEYLHHYTAQKTQFQAVFENITENLVKNFLAQPIFCQNEFLFCCSPPYRQIRCLYITL